MERKLLSGIFSYYPRENHSPKENFITEVLSYSLNKVPQFNQDFLGLIQNKLKNDLSIPNFQSYEWVTQFRVYSGNIPDLVLLEAEIPRIIVEVKVDSGLGEKQIERYKQDVKYTNQAVPVIIIGKDNNQNTQETDAFISWTDIYSILIISAQEMVSPIGRWLLDEFASLLITMEIVKLPIHKDEILNYSKNYFKFKKLGPSIVNTFNSLEKSNGKAIHFKPPFQSPKYCGGHNSGIEGLRWTKDIDIHNSKDWAPSVFMGIVTNPSDHALDDICKDEIPFITVISINKSLYPFLHQLEEWKTFRNSVRQSLSSGWKVLDRTEFSLNPWHPFILHKPLSELFSSEEPVSVEEAIKDAIKEMIPIIQTAFDSSGLLFKFEELLKV